MFPTAGAPPPEAPERGDDVPGQCRSGGWPLTNFSTQQPQTLPRGKCRVDIMTHLTGGHTGLVVRVVRDPWPRQPPGICMESVSVVQTAKGTKSCDEDRQ